MKGCVFADEEVIDQWFMRLINVTKLLKTKIWNGTRGYFV